MPRLARIALLALALLASCAETKKAPLAAAGTDQSVATGTLVQLDGSKSSDPQGLPLAYAWSFRALPAASRAALNDPSLAAPAFTADVPGTYVIQLVVSNGVLRSEPSQVTVTATACGASAPIARIQVLSPVAAGPSGTVAVPRMPVGSTVQLSGAASTDPDNAAGCNAGQTLSYGWQVLSLPAGSRTALNATAMVAPSFVADVPGTYVVGLTVTDSTGRSSAPATATLVADPSMPVALLVTGFSISTVNAGAAQLVEAPRGVAVDANGAIYVAESGSSRITRHVGGTVTVVTEGGLFSGALQGLALDVAGGRLLATQGDGRIVAVTPAGVQSLAWQIPGGRSFNGIALWASASAGPRIAVADQGNDVIVFLNPATGATTTNDFAGGAGTALAAPWGVAAQVEGGADVAFAANSAAPSVVRNASGATALNAGTSNVLASDPTLDDGHGVALTPCATPKLVVAGSRQGNLVVLKDCATSNCSSGSNLLLFATGFSRPVGLAFDTSTAPAGLVVTDEALGAIFRVTGDFCSL